MDIKDVRVLKEQLEQNLLKSIRNFQAVTHSRVSKVDYSVDDFPSVRSDYIRERLKIEVQI